MPRTPIHALLSHPGRVRRNNEDTAAAGSASPLRAFVICDGMGGAAAGEVASRLASQTFLSAVLLPSSSQPQARLRAAIQAANHAVYRYSRQSSELAGMGTTLVSLLYIEPAPDAPPSLWLANLGDSRCYLHRDGSLTQLTSDHSFIEEQIRAGQLTPAEAATSPLRNLITRAIGSKCCAEPDILPLQPSSGDLYLLASDGLTRELSDLEIRELLNSRPAQPTEAALHSLCQSLIAAANGRGGNDNITVLLVAFP